ncbi:aminotransferase-like domain-containing protein [Pedobacter frigoris]|uniref:Uncharacterized protein n=1 Tax=Pedobacter frigoris TaxID=2571272 RepID=A0A4U1CKC9_9SPHI|nr:hypothetical protein [Pedobacter frigoris]TKC07490.1 hypothetical protein FA047_09595 [Pedobacter frigoris]
MNFLILGTEIPDYSHPVLLKYNPQENAARPLTEDEKIMKAVKMLQSNSYASDLEKLRLYYKEKLQRLQVVYNEYLSKYGVFNMPSGGLGAWIKLNQDQHISPILAPLAEIGIYQPNDNPQLDTKLPIVGIRAGFGSPDIETYEKAFGLLAAQFKTVK